jgi:predicted ABC-type ATPase
LPNLYIIAGCNGAGKTTASYTVLPEILHCKEFINADEIARGLSPFQPEKAAIAAGRIMLQRIDELLNLKIDFAIETTLTTKSYINTIKAARQNGYTITLLYFWLNNVELAIERVKLRVKSGGHNIPEAVIRRRYKNGMANLVKIFIGHCNSWVIINNSEKNFTFIAEGEEGKDYSITKVYDDNTWKKIIKHANE